MGKQGPNGKMKENINEHCLKNNRLNFKDKLVNVLILKINFLILKINDLILKDKGFHF
jgi:hypothetical protein